MALTIHPDLQSALPALSDDELSQLEANLLQDGFVIDPILFFSLDSEQVVLDGMHRLPIAEKHNLPFSTKEIPSITTLEQAEAWILDHQFGRRNVLKPKAIRKIRGRMYNQQKRKDGGHGKQVQKPKQESGCQIDTPPTDKAISIAKQTGVSEITIKRDAKFAAALTRLPAYLAKAIETGTAKSTDDAVLKLADCERNIQEEVARDVRVGIHRNIQDALKARNLLKDTPSKNQKKDKPVDQACKNTNRELFRDTPDNDYSDSLFLTESGGIGINVDGLVIVRTLKQWHQAATLMTPEIISLNEKQADVRHGPRNVN